MQTKHSSPRGMIFAYGRCDSCVCTYDRNGWCKQSLPAVLSSCMTVFFACKVTVMNIMNNSMGLYACLYVYMHVWIKEISLVSIDDSYCHDSTYASAQEFGRKEAWRATFESTRRTFWLRDSRLLSFVVIWCTSDSHLGSVINMMHQYNIAIRLRLCMCQDKLWQGNQSSSTVLRCTGVSVSASESAYFL